MAARGRLAGVHWNGLDTFRDELKVLAEGLTDEANTIMLESAAAAKQAISDAYPVKQGGLRNGLEIRPSRGVLIAGAELRQNAPHGQIYEKGTKPRKNKAGAGRGRMTPHPTFEPIAEAYRRAAIRAVIARVYQHGATRVVSDEFAA